MSLRVFTGLPATGKTSAIITEMRARESSGDEVVLLLSSEHEELTARKNVRPGGLMGCRVASLYFEISGVLDTDEAIALLEASTAGTLLAFDEAQFFAAEIVAAWNTASSRGVDILVGSPSVEQLHRLEQHDFEHKFMQVDCKCGAGKANHVAYDDNDTVFPTHLCQSCYEARNSEIAQLLRDVKQSKPFPGDLHTYQPFYDVDMSEWQLVRGDSPARLQIILEAVARCDAVKSLIADPLRQPSFLDLGSCSGFFTDGMLHHGFATTGVDVDKNFVDWGRRLAEIKEQSIRYIQSDAHDYIVATTDEFDVSSTFATIQWVMTQKDYATGLACFSEFFKKTLHIAIVEMGYNTEDIYKDRIKGAPVIDKDWVLKLMADSGEFATIEVHPAQENGIWRDVFVGFKEVPTAYPFLGTPFTTATVRQASVASGYWEDSWVGTSFEIWLKSEQALSSLHLEAWRPDGEPADITFQLNGVDLLSLSSVSGLFSRKIPLQIASGDIFRFSASMSPAVSVEKTADSRELGIAVRKLVFT